MAGRRSVLVRDLRTYPDAPQENVGIDVITVFMDREKESERGLLGYFINTFIENQYEFILRVVRIG